MVKRIKGIATHNAESSLIRMKGICIFALVVLLVFMHIPFISVLATSDDSRFHFHGDHVRYVDLDSFFGDFEGSFVLYDMDTGLYTINNRRLSETRVSPFSTSKIVSTLVALEVGVLDGNNTLREWDGVIQPFDAWNQSHDLASAMASSVDWYFRDLDLQIGMDNLSYYLNLLSYGNLDLSGGLGAFWNGSSLRISPIEQVQILAGLHRDSSVFESGNIDILRDVLRLSERDGVVLSGKTGTGFVDGWVTGGYGWFIGYVERDGSVFVFATHIHGGDEARGSAAVGITLAILEDMGVY